MHALLCLRWCRVAEYSPTRTTQLNPALWIAAGYNEQDTYEFLASYRESMYHPNIRLETRFPGGIARAAAWAELTTPQALNMSTSQWMKVATQRFSSIINTTFVSVASCHVGCMLLYLTIPS